MKPKNTVAIKGEVCPFCIIGMKTTHIAIHNNKKVNALICLKCNRIYLKEKQYEQLDEYVKSIGNRLNSRVYCYSKSKNIKSHKSSLTKPKTQKQNRERIIYTYTNKKHSNKPRLYKETVIGIQRKSCQYFSDSQCELLHIECNILNKSCIQNNKTQIVKSTQNESNNSESIPINSSNSKKSDLYNLPKTDISKIGVTVIVLCDNRKCTENNHRMKDLNAAIRIVTPIGKIMEKEIPAAYCYDCMKYFVLKVDYENLKVIGIPLCPVEDRSRTAKNNSPQKFTSGSESELHRRGYNVRKASNFTDEQRIVILADILENTDITRYEIISNLSKNIRQHQKQANYSDAIRQWSKDLNAIQEYKTGDIPEILISKVIIGKR